MKILVLQGRLGRTVFLRLKTINGSAVGKYHIGTYASRFHTGILQYHEVIIKTSLTFSGTFKNRVTSLLVAIERYQKGEHLWLYMCHKTVYF